MAVRGNERSRRRPRFGRAPARLLAVVRPVFTSSERGRVLRLVAVLIGLLFAVNGLNVVASYVGRDFMTSLAERRAGRFFTAAGLYAGAFAVLTVTAVYYRFAEERLALLWRGWLTQHFVDRYFTNRAYHRLAERGRPDNPDQRISEDVRTFTVTTLSLLLILSNSAIGLVAFSGVLWSITPWLVAAAGLTAAAGTAATLLVGRRLAGLNFDQLRFEADFRFGLVRIREHADAIALVGGEAHEAPGLRDRLGRALENMRRVITVNRNLGFFTTGYGYLTQLVPVLVTAPLYLRGELEFGAVTQAGIAFGHVLGAFSIVIVEFQRLAGFKAVVDRLGELIEAFEAPPSTSGIDVAQAPDRIAFERLTLRTPDGRSELIRELSLEVSGGRRVVVRGPNGAGRTALVRATAGLWPHGTGRILRPPAGRILFLPQRPYLRAGSLREQLRYGVAEVDSDDSRVVELLRQARLGPVLDRAGGLDSPRDWPAILSEGEQQALAFARLILARPAFAVLDEATGSLDADAARNFYRLLVGSGITYISFDNDPALSEFHDLALDLRLDGTWRVGPAMEPRSAADPRDSRWASQSSPALGGPRSEDRDEKAVPGRAGESRPGAASS